MLKLQYLLREHNQSRYSRFRILITLLLGFVIGLCTLPASSASDRVIRVLLDEDKEYPLLQVSALGKNGFRSSLKTSECPSITDKMFAGAYRFELELTMLCKALAKANLADRLDFFPYPSINRAVAEVEANRADVVGSTLFNSQATGDVARSEATLRKDEFQVALFTTPGRDDIRSIVLPQNLNKLRGLTVKNWRLDREALLRMNLKDVISARKMTQIPQMIAQRRADFTLSYLDRPTTMHMGGPLVRIDGFRVSLNDERVFVVSTSRPELLVAINQFIQLNRDQPVDQIRAAYMQTGFITDKYDHWLEVGDGVQK